MYVGQAAGAADVRVTASMNGESFEENVELPVRPASPALQFGAYAAASTTQPTILSNLQPLLPGTEAINVRITPWPTLRLPQGLDYLDRYPYGCVEQTTSTLFPLITLGEHRQTTRSRPLRSAADEGDDQHRNHASDRHANSRRRTGDVAGRVDGVAVGNGVCRRISSLKRGRPVTTCRRTFISHTARVCPAACWTARRTTHRTWKLQAYAAYVLSLAGTPPRAAIDRLTELTKKEPGDPNQLDDLAVREDARMMLACAWVLAGRHDIADGMIPQTLPLPRKNRQQDGNIGSPIRDRAMLISTVTMVQPANPALPALVQQLADEGDRGHWASTQDTAFAVMAIGRYLQLEQKREPYDHGACCWEPAYWPKRKGAPRWRGMCRRQCSRAAMNHSACN